MVSLADWLTYISQSHANKRTDYCNACNEFADYCTQDAEEQQAEEDEEEDDRDEEEEEDDRDEEEGEFIKFEDVLSPCIVSNFVKCNLLTEEDDRDEEEEMTRMKRKMIGMKVCIH